MTLLGDLDTVADYLESQRDSLPTYLAGMASKLRVHEQRLRREMAKADGYWNDNSYGKLLRDVNGGPVKP